MKRSITVSIDDEAYAEIIRRGHTPERFLVSAAVDRLDLEGRFGRLTDQLIQVLTYCGDEHDQPTNSTGEPRPVDD